MSADLLSWAVMVEDESRRRWRGAGTEGTRGTHRIRTKGNYTPHTEPGKVEDDEEEVQQRDMKTRRGRLTQTEEQRHGDKVLRCRSMVVARIPNCPPHSA